MIKKSIETYKKYDVKVGFCGQQPSDSIEFYEFLVKSGIDSISVTLILNKNICKIVSNVICLNLNNKL